MEVYTIGFTRRTAEDFFETLKRAGIRRLVDVRLHNSSQLAGFAKQADFPYFLRAIAGIEYVHEPLLAPTQDILACYRKQGGSWEEYASRFLALLAERRVEEAIPCSLLEGPAVLLCSERTADQCHRRLILEYLNARWGGIQAVHL